MDEAKLDRLVRMELGASDVERVAIDVAAGRAAIEVRHRDGSTRTGTIELGGSRDRERTLALFVGELSRDTSEPPPSTSPSAPASSAPASSASSSSATASSASSSSAPASSAPAASASAAPAALSSPPSASPAPRESPVAPRDRGAIGPYVHAGAAARLVTAGGALFLGPLLEVGTGIAGRVRAGFVARYAIAAAADPLGTIRAQNASGGVALAYRFLATRAIALDTGPRIDVGWLGGHGVGTGGSATANVSFVGAWTIESRFAIAGPFALALALEIGWLAPGLDLRADDRAPLRAAGALAGANVGLVLDL